MDSYAVIVAFLLCFTGTFYSGVTPLQCRDEADKPVDWYIVYKFPYLSAEAAAKPIFSGHRYATISSTAPEAWSLSPYDISAKESSIFAKTLDPIYGTGSTKYNTLFYSDQPAGTTSTASSTYAHSKGILATDSSQGFWLIHTVPRFAPGNGSFEYVDSGTRYGQVAMCLSLSVAELEKVVTKNFLTSKVYSYHTNILNATNPIEVALTNLKNKKWSSDLHVVTNLTTLRGQSFQSFYKSPNELVDLYAGIVATSVQGALLVETWRRSPFLDSECSLPKTRVENVFQVQVKLPNSDQSGSFKYTQDHSKWAISGQESGQSHVCLGDVNRMESQFKRGGGTTCIAMPSVWRAFYSFVEEIEKCGESKKFDEETEEDVEEEIHLAEKLHLKEKFHLEEKIHLDNVHEELTK